MTVKVLRGAHCMLILEYTLVNKANLVHNFS